MISKNQLKEYVNSGYNVSEIENAVLKEYERLLTEGEENEAAYDAEDE